MNDSTFEISESTVDKLKKKAKEISTNSYSPYSNFQVGAAVLLPDGNIVGGTNVENASYGLTICAERAAIFDAVKSGYRKILAIAIYTPTETLTMPCGACREVIKEFGSNSMITCFCDSDDEFHSSLDLMLPGIS